jgi:hypothetical protein
MLNVFQIVVCPFVLFRLAIVLSVLLGFFTDPGYIILNLLIANFFFFSHICPMKVTEREEQTRRCAEFMSKLNFCLVKFKLWYSIQSDLVRRKLAFYWIKNVIRVDIPTYKNSMSSEPDFYCRHSGIWLFHFGYVLLFDQGMTFPYPRNIAAYCSIKAKAL